MRLLSVIIRELDIICVTLEEPETDPPLVIHRNGILAFSIPFEWVKPVVEGNLQIVQTGG